MVAQSAKAAMANARRYKTCRVGMCLMYTRTWLGIGARYGSAIAAWNGAKKRHGPKSTPPKGAPVFWRGGRHGHIALSMGGGKCRSTDRPRGGVVSTVSIDSITRAWGYTYVGWTEDLNGVTIPYLANRDAPTARPAPVKPSASKKGVPLDRPRTFHVTARRLNARTGPGKRYPVARVRKRGATFHATRKTKSWIMGRNGLWYARKYVKSGRK